MTVHAERIERTITFTLGIADNRFYAEKLSTLLLQDAVGRGFVASLSEREVTHFALLGINIQTLHAIAFCTAQVVPRFRYTQDDLKATGTWEYNPIHTLHRIASNTTRDDMLYLLKQVYLQHTDQMGIFLQLRKRTLNSNQPSAESLVTRYQTQAKRLTQQQMLQQACQFMTLDMNDKKALKRAGVAWRTLHEAQPSWAIARYFMARIMLQQAQPKTAHDLLVPISQARTSAIYLLTYGDALAALDKTDDALATWQRALTQRPTFYTTNKSLATRFAQHNQPEQQVTALQQAIALRPSDHHALFALANLVRTSNPDLYVTYLEQTISARPDYLPAYNQLIAVYADKQLDRALELATIAMNIAPNNADQLITLGGLYAQQGELQQALFHYQQALVVDSSPTTRARLQARLVP